MMRRITAWAFLAAAALWLPAAGAGSFSISPLRVDLSAQARTVALKVRNEDPAPVVIQAEVMQWDQQEGKDELVPTRDLLVSPPLFTLEPGAEQVLRVALRGAADPARELSYRLVLQEVPPESGQAFTGLSVLLRLSLPVFVAPAAPASPVLEWSAGTGDDGALVISVANTGTAHGRILGFRLVSGGQDVAPVEQPVVAYVLPGRQRSWRFDGLGRTPGPWRLEGRTDEGEFALELGVTP